MDFQSDDNFNGQQYRPPVRPQDVMLTASAVLSVIAIPAVFMHQSCVVHSVSFWHCSPAGSRKSFPRRAGWRS